MLNIAYILFCSFKNITCKPFHDSIQEEVVELINKASKNETKDLSSRLVEDLKIDSLDRVELIMALETKDKEL